jgi:threonine dehydrogenase-like Zn-dependent dehydrogenase
MKKKNRTSRFHKEACHIVRGLSAWKCTARVISSTIVNHTGYDNQEYVGCYGEVEKTSISVRDLHRGDKIFFWASSISRRVDVPENQYIMLEPKCRRPEICHLLLIGMVLKSLRNIPLHQGETMLVGGTGLIGLIAIQLAKTMGAKTIAVDGKTKRLESARQCGADILIHATGKSLQRTKRFHSHLFRVDQLFLSPFKDNVKAIKAILQEVREGTTTVCIDHDPMEITGIWMPRGEAKLHFYSYPSENTQSELRGDPLKEPYGYMRWSLRQNMMEIQRLVRENRFNLSRISKHRCEALHPPRKKMTIQDEILFEGIEVYYE